MHKLDKEDKDGAQHPKNIPHNLAEHDLTMTPTQLLASLLVFSQQVD